MPRYYFDFIDGSMTCTDPQGSEFYDLEAVRKEAVGFVLERANDYFTETVAEHVECVVRQDTGAVVLKVTLRLKTEIPGEATT